MHTGGLTPRRSPRTPGRSLMDLLARTPVLPAAKAVPPCALRPTLSVVIVNYRHWEDTGRVVNQLRAQPALRRGDAEVVIVDNHSPPHPLLPRLRRTEGVSLRRWRSNRGFARAVNEGCRLSRGDWFVLLNPDTAVSPSFLAKTLRRAKELVARDPLAGIIGFRLENPDGTHQLSTGRFPGFVGTLGRLLLPRRRRKYTVPSADGPTKVDWLTGCCLLVRRDCWDDLGGLDPDFFLYYEDVDFCRRASQRGWSVWYDPTVSIAHHRPMHQRAVPAHLRLLTRHALLTYARKHWPDWQTRLLAGIVKMESVLRRWWARWSGDAGAPQVFEALGRITEDMSAGRMKRARRRLLRVVEDQEQHRAAYPVDRHPEPQPSRPAPALSRERPEACAAGC
jgi:GT2 family glycosyltransferase